MFNQKPTSGMSSLFAALMSQQQAQANSQPPPPGAQKMPFPGAEGVAPDAMQTIQAQTPYAGVPMSPQAGVPLGGGMQDFSTPPNPHTRTPPAVNRAANADAIQDAYRNNWQPNPVLLRAALK